MLSSIFKDWKIAFWIDYLKREDCVEVVNFTQEQIIKLQNGCKYENGEIVTSPEYLEKIEKEEKDLVIKNLKELSDKSIKNLALFDATQRMYETNELKTHELNLLEHRGQELLEEINIAKSEAIEKYGIEILEELL